MNLHANIHAPFFQTSIFATFILPGGDTALQELNYVFDWPKAKLYTVVQ